MKAIVNKSSANGGIRIPASKSYTHRAIVCGLLSNERTEIHNPLICDDTLATINASRLMGANIRVSDILEIEGPAELHAPSSKIDCSGSGTTLRVFTALAALTKGTCILTGDVTLQARVVEDLLDGLRQLGIRTHSIPGNGKPPLIVQGQGFKGGLVRIRGDVSSQYITALLFACSKGMGDTKIEITTQLESKQYVVMTMDTMRHFGVHAYASEAWSQIGITGPQEYRASRYSVEGDYSSAAFLLAAGALTGRVKVSGVEQATNQGDAMIVELLRLMGAAVTFEKDGIIVIKRNLQAIRIDASNIPDLVPILAVLATQADGVTVIQKARRLRFKESDRLSSISKEISKMGASIREHEDGLLIKGPTPLRGAVLDSHQDHRIAMAGVIAGLVADGPTTVKNIETVRKSYPEFIEHMKEIGVQIDVEMDRGG